MPDAPPTSSLTRTISRYALSRVYRQVFGLLIVVLRPKLLPTELFGVWTLMKSVLAYSSNAYLGLRAAMRLRIPFLLARGDDAEVRQVASTAISFALVINILVALGVLAVSMHKGWGPEAKLALTLTACVIVVQFVYESAISLLRAHERFDLVTRANYVHTTSLFLLSAPLIYFLRLPGLFLSIIGAQAITIIYIRSRIAFGLRPSFDVTQFRSLIGEGFPIMLMDMGIMFVTTSDRFVVSAMLGNEQLGYYGIAVLALAFLMNLAGTAREVLEPRLMREIENAPAHHVMDHYVLRPLLKTAYLLPFLIGPIYILIPVAIPLTLPRYATGVAPAQTLAIAALFLALVQPLRTVITAKGWQWWAVAFLPVIIAVNLGLSIFYVRSGAGLAGIAIASGIAYTLLCAVFGVLVAVKLQARNCAWRPFAAALPWPLLLLLLTVVLVRPSPEPDMITAILQASTFAAIHAALTIFTSRTCTLWGTK